MTPIFDEIRATDLVEWAGRAESERWMPSLLRQLVLASGAKLRKCRFLTHEQTNLGGWDGIVEADEGGLCVPAGVSGWELSKKRRAIPDKARLDITKREPSEVVPATSVFVAVTLCIWPRRKLDDGSFQESHEHKAAWEQEQAIAFGWREVRALDAADLADWIAQSPGIGMWLAHVMGRNVAGARSLLAHWEDLATLRPKLAPETFLAGRGEFAKRLDEWMSAPSTEAFEIRSWSHVDVRDAVAAWWFNRIERGELSPVSPVAVSTADAWNHLVRTAKPLLLLADSGLELTTEQVSAAIARGHYVLVRSTAGHSPATGCKLPPLHRDALSEELRKCGIENSEAWRLAGEAGGSGVALKRILRPGHGPDPEWAKQETASGLAPAAFFGAWDANAEADRGRMAEVFGMSFENIEKLLTPWAEANDPLVRRTEQHWRVVSREDAWRWLSPHLTVEHYKRFRSAAVVVLTELDPQYDLPAGERIYAGIRKAVPKHSYRLRQAMAETLCLLSLRSPESEEGAQARNLARAIVGEVFERVAGDWRLWASLGFALVFIAEAAPDLFLKAVEDDLRRESPATLELFKQAGDGVFGGFPHVNLMWALEGLMWDRECVARAVVVLARMAALDPGGNSNPRPMGVLREAFLPWFPQCCLNVADRCRVLDKLEEAEPDIARKLFFALLPQKLDHSSPWHRPSYRRASGASPRDVTVAEYWEQVAHVARRLVLAAGTDAEKWHQLIEEIDVLPEDIADTVLAQVESLSGGLGEESRTKLWETLRKEAGKHRYFATAKWAMQESKLAKMAKLVIALEPTNPVLRHAWLFCRQEVFLPGTTSETPFEEQHRLQDEARVLALKEIVAFGGVNAIRQLMGRIKDFDAHSAGFLAGRNPVGLADADVLPGWLDEQDRVLKSFARGYALGRSAKDGWQWLHQIGVSKWEATTFGAMSDALPFTGETWARVDELGSAFADAYWRSASTYMHGGSIADAERAVRELTSRGRALAALTCVDSCIYHKVALSADVLLAVLEAVRAVFVETSESGKSENTAERLDVYDTIRVLEALQKRSSLSPDQTHRVELLEWFFLPILENHGAPRILPARINREPAYFVELLTLTRWPDDLPKESRTKPTEEQIRIAENTRRLLDSLVQLPGTNSDGVLDEKEFRSWVKAAREVATSKGYCKSFEDLLGTWLLHSPIDPAGYWPCAAVCRLLCEDGSEELTDAFGMAIFNNQGWPGPLGHGRVMCGLDERREAMEKLREFAAKLDLEFPIVAGILRYQADREEEILNRRFRDDD